MRRLSVRIIVALLAFLLGIVATSAWFIWRSPQREQLRVVVPDEGWTKIVFESTGLGSRSINEITDQAHLSNLRTTLLPSNDLEVRFWSGFGEDGRVRGVILKRSGGQWSVLHLMSYRREPLQKYQDMNEVPPSGWERAWAKLSSAGIVTLPDASAVQCTRLIADGLDYIVEININRTYRTYRYQDLEPAPCAEAVQMQKIAGIMSEEFEHKDSVK